MSAHEVVSTLLVTLGVLLIAIAGIGLVRLPDVYNRANAVAKAAGLGLCSVLLGVVVLTPSTSAVLTLLVATAVQLFTVPLSSFKIGEAAYLSDAPMTAGTRRRDRPSAEQD